MVVMIYGILSTRVETVRFALERRGKVLPRRTAAEIEADKALSDLVITVTPKQREKIITLLLNGETHDVICKEVRVTLPQVAEVADTIKGKLREAERKRVDELHALTLYGTVKAFKLMIQELDKPNFPVKMMPSFAGVFFDKWLLLKGSTSLSQSLIVSGTANMDDAISKAMVTLTRISGNTDPVDDDDEGENEE